MKKTNYLLLAITVFVVLFASACGGSAAPATQAAPPPAEIVPTQAPAEIVVPTAQPPAVPAQTFAPACQAAASCAAPEVKDTAADKTYCVEKIPYQNISVMPGTTFEILDPTGELKCQDSGTVVDGKNVITCTGKELWTYELMFTNSACAANGIRCRAELLRPPRRCCYRLCDHQSQHGRLRASTIRIYTYDSPKTIVPQVFIICGTIVFLFYD
jgi:hypothetical protein